MYLSSLTAQLKPIDKESMQSLKKVSEDIEKKRQFESLIKYIYNKAVTKASTSSIKTHKEVITINPKEYTMSVNGISFERSQIVDIVNRLRELFPSCLVEHKMLSRGQDGKLYDISKLDGVLPFVDRKNDQACFLIDWS
jgi:hypothetical protein